MNRNQHLQNLLKAQTFDIVIIGGGATGAGCALDAALRGLNVALIEKHDFAAMTSSKSTKLAHGGVRYLEQAVKKLDYEQFKLVKKGLSERKNLLNNAPHLARPLALLTPCFNIFAQFYYFLGLKIYDWLSGKQSIGKSQWLSKRQTLNKLPVLDADKLSGSVLYYDGQFDDARYCLALAKTAATKGATVINYTQVIGFQKDTNTNKINVVVIEDLMTQQKFEIRTQLVVNATGIFADQIRLMANPNMEQRIKVSKGAHIILPAALMPGDTAILIPETDDGRVLFIIPWQEHLLVGTTDEAAELDENTTLDYKDIDYMLDYLNRYLVTPILKKNIQAGFAGLRPLLQADPNESTASVVRDHEVEVDNESGLISIMGGKWTTYRIMAKDTIDKCYEYINNSFSECCTENQLLDGGESYDKNLWKNLVKEYDIAEDIAHSLCQRYGINAKKIASDSIKNPNTSKRLHPQYPFIIEEISYSLREEMTTTFDDLMSRRFGLEHKDWNACIALAPSAAQEMGKQMGWDDAKIKQTTKDYISKVKKWQLSLKNSDWV